MARMWSPGTRSKAPDRRGYVVRPLPECAPYRRCSGRNISLSARGTTTNQQCARRARFLRVYDGVAFAVCDRHVCGSS
jgi:hypothetical protein